MMNRFLIFVALLLLHLGVFSSANSQVISSDSHTVTVRLSTIVVVQVSAPSINLTVTGAGVAAGQDLMSVTDQSSNLFWGVNSSGKKITINTNLAIPVHTLKVVALSPSVGSAAPEVTLSTTAADFVLNIGRTSGSCTLKYSGIVLASEGMASDVHTITFTIQTQ